MLSLRDLFRAITVCRYWYNVSFCDAATLWSRIVWTGQPITFLRGLLARAGNVPIDLTVQFRGVSRLEIEAYNELGNHLEHVKRLDVQLSTRASKSLVEHLGFHPLWRALCRPAPILEGLTLRGTIGKPYPMVRIPTILFACTAPSFRTLTLRGVFNIPTVCPVIAQVQRMTLTPHRASMDDIYALASICPRMQQLVTTVQVCLEPRSSSEKASPAQDLRSDSPDDLVRRFVCEQLGHLRVVYHDDVWSVLLAKAPDRFTILCGYALARFDVMHRDKSVVTIVGVPSDAFPPSASFSCVTQLTMAEKWLVRHLSDMPPLLMLTSLTLILLDLQDHAHSTGRAECFWDYDDLIEMEEHSLQSVLHQVWDRPVIICPSVRDLRLAAYADEQSNWLHLRCAAAADDICRFVEYGLGQSGVKLDSLTLAGVALHVDSINSFNRLANGVGRIYSRDALVKRPGSWFA